MPPAGFEPTIPASEWPQKRALDRAATRISSQDALTALIQEFIRERQKISSFV